MVVCMSNVQTQVGWAKIEIPVAEGTPLAGYEGGSPRLASGIHDPLYVRAVTIAEGERRVCIVSCDLVAVDTNFVRRLSLKTGRWGIKSEDFFLAATHCHAGPAGLFEEDDTLGGLFSAVAGTPDHNLIDKLEECVLKAVENSILSLCPATLRAGVVESPGIGTDRNNPSSPGDGRLSVLQFETADGTHALIYSIACHPTVLNAENTLVSADFPGAASRALEQSPVQFAMFLNGSAGDVSTRFTRKSSDFDEVERLGALLAKEVRRALDILPPAQADFTLEGSAFSAKLLVRKVGSPEEAGKTLNRLKTELAAAQAQGLAKGELRQLESRCEGALMNLLYSQNRPDIEYLSISVRLLRIGKLLLVFFPLEVFSALTNSLREEMPELVPVGYANGYYGYLPDAAIEHTDNYEKYTTILAYGEGEALMSEVKRISKEKQTR